MTCGVIQLLVPFLTTLLLLLVFAFCAIPLLLFYFYLNSNNWRLFNCYDSLWNKCILYVCVLLFLE